MEREATLGAIGYICHDNNVKILKHQSNQILTAIIHGMQKLKASNHVRLSASNTLLNSLELTEMNFERTLGDIQICVAALQCLIKIITSTWKLIWHRHCSQSCLKQ